MEKKMTELEKKTLMARLESELPYDLGGETEVFDNCAFIELYGKAYGRGSSGDASYEISGGRLHLTEAEGDTLKSLAEYIYKDFLKAYPQIKSFSIMAQFD